MTESTVQCSTIAELRNMTGSTHASAYVIIDPGQEGLFIFDPTDTGSANNTGTILVTASGS